LAAARSKISCYVFADPHTPMFFAVWKRAAIKTTVLRELEEVCDVTYREFQNREELREDLHDFFCRVDRTTAYRDLVGHVAEAMDGVPAPEPRGLHNVNLEQAS
jgi:hypothetical protein